MEDDRAAEATAAPRPARHSLDPPVGGGPTAGVAVEVDDDDEALGDDEDSSRNDETNSSENVSNKRVEAAVEVERVDLRDGSVLFAFSENALKKPL